MCYAYVLCVIVILLAVVDMLNMNCLCNCVYTAVVLFSPLSFSYFMSFLQLTEANLRMSAVYLQPKQYSGECVFCVNFLSN